MGTAGDTRACRKHRGHALLRKRDAELFESGVGPHAPNRRQERLALLCGFKREFRAAPIRCRQFREFNERSSLLEFRAPPSLAKEDAVIASSAESQIGLKPFDEGSAAADVPCLDSPFQAMGVAVGADREGGRQPALQP